MEEHILTIRSVKKITHDVLQIDLEKPRGYEFIPGQATEVALNRPGWENENRPFTFTSLPSDPHLQFTIKTYPSHKGFTNELLSLSPGDQLILHDVWGAIHYQGEGTFIAGGAGVTPFLSIFRDLEKKNQLASNRLIFANKTQADIIQKDELGLMLGSRFINILSDEKLNGFAKGYITEEFLRENIAGIDKKFYVCGPPPMMDAVQGMLTKLGVSEGAVVVEI
jgi:ferredoxin-NADP reductase